MSRRFFYDFRLNVDEPLFAKHFYVFNVTFASLFYSFNKILGKPAF
jgi:hypothetical protein